VRDSAIRRAAAAPPLADLRVARFFDGAIFTWHDGDAAGRAPDLAVLLDHAQRLGRLGGWEENLVTGLVRWTDSAFELFGLVPRSGTEIPLADLHSYVMAADMPVVTRFRQRLAERREAATATFRVVHPDDGSIRQIRVFAEPVTDAANAVVALRGAFQVTATPGNRQVSVSAPSKLRAGRPSTVTVTLGAGGNQVVHGVRLALQLPPGWTARPDGPAAFATVTPGEAVTARFTVIPPSGAPNASGRRRQRTVHPYNGSHAATSAPRHVRSRLLARGR